jgi:TatD DNase family protein
VKTRENLYASIGIHPHEAATYVGEQQARQDFANLAMENKVKAVGECGLDYFYERSPREAQIELLKFQIELALEHNLPVIFHVREAFDDFWPIFDSYSDIQGVLHSFTDTQANLDKAVERGLYVGVNGIATFAKQPNQLEMYRSIPLKNLLLETDAPFLTPVPYRGNICEPYHVSTTANFLKDLRGEDLETLAKATTSNAKQLFGVS